MVLDNEQGAQPKEAKTQLARYQSNLFLPQTVRNMVHPFHNIACVSLMIPFKSRTNTRESGKEDPGVLFSDVLF